MSEKKLTIQKIHEGNRIDKVLGEIYKEYTRNTIQRLIDENKIFVNGKNTKASYKVHVGDVIDIEEENPVETRLKEENIPLDVLYEDEDIIVVNKEKGMVVHPGNGNPDGTLVNAILAKCKGSLSGIGGEIRPRNSAQTR